MKKKVFAILTVCALMACLAVPAFAETATVVSSTDFQSVLSALTSQISVSTVVGVLVTLVGACVGFVFLWWGVRKVSGALTSAFKNGKIKM